jgi:hypothetical protein
MAGDRLVEMKNMKHIIVLLGLVTAFGCKVSGTVQCQTDENCDVGTGGACLRNPRTKHFWCSYPDVACPSGVRWSELDVGDGVGGQCADPLALDRTPPVIVGRTPSPDSQGVAPTTLISVTFSEAIDPASVSADSFQLQDQGGNAVEASFVTTGTEVVLTPKLPLDPRLDYRIAVTPELTDLAGNGVPETASWGFRTKDAEWSTPVPLELEQSKTATIVEAAANHGVIVAAWTFAPCIGTTCTAVDEVWAAVRKDGIWGTAVKLGTATQLLLRPSVAVAPDGRAVVLWSQRSGSPLSQIFAAHFDGSRWSPATPLIEDNERQLFIWSTDSASDGSFDILWSDRFAARTNRVWTSRYQPASGWSSPFGFGEYDSMGLPLVKIASGSPSFVARIGDRQLFINQRDSDTWSGPKMISAVPPYESFVDLVRSRDGATVLWAADHVFSRRITNGVWEDVVQLDGAAAMQPSGSSVPGKYLAYLSSGTTVAIWSASDGVWQAVRPAERPWGPSFPINGGSPPAARLQMASGGRRALAIWRTSDLHANEYSDLIGWRGVMLAENQTTPVSDAAVVYDSTTNTFVAIWLQANAAGLVDVLSNSYR